MTTNSHVVIFKNIADNIFIKINATSLGIEHGSLQSCGKPLPYKAMVLHEVAYNAKRVNLNNNVSDQKRHKALQPNLLKDVSFTNNSSQLHICMPFYFCTTTTCSAYICKRLG